MNTKQCVKCLEFVGLDEFPRNRSSKDGHHHYCKTCKSESDRQSYLKNRESRIESVKAYRRDNLEKVKAARKARYHEDVDENREKAKDWYYTNHDRAKEYRRSRLPIEREKRRQNPISRLLYRLQSHRRRARERANGGKFSKEEWFALCEYYGNICLCCRETKPLVADHIVPISKGGENTIENIQPLCASCNAHKHTKTIDYRW